MDPVLQALQELSLNPPDDSFSEDGTKSALLEVCQKGSGGSMLFEKHVVPFLTLKDLVRSSNSCRRLNAMCRMYTVGEILDEHVDGQIDHASKLALGKFLIAFADPRYSQGCKPRRLMRDPTGNFRALLYHPSTIPDILLGMTAFFSQKKLPLKVSILEDFDWNANSSLPQVPVLVSATYGAGDHDTRTDVTLILKYVLIARKNRQLVLKCPPNGPRYWYNYLFGDPCYKKTKELRLRLRYPNGECRDVIFREDSRVSIALRAEPGTGM